MAKAYNIKFHAEAWDELVTGVVQRWAVPRAEEIADACNEHVLAEAAKSLQEPESDDSATVYRTNADRVRADMAKARARANRRISHIEPPEGKRDYMVSVEGSNPLNLKDYRATVIAVTDRAKIDNARNQTLVRNFHLASGGD